jgi:hypothetical protein
VLIFFFSFFFFYLVSHFLEGVNNCVLYDFFSFPFEFI